VPEAGAPARPEAEALEVTYLYQRRCQEAIEALKAVVATEPDHPAGGGQSGCGLQHSGPAG
jgi:hypothetical protein